MASNSSMVRQRFHDSNPDLLMAGDEERSVLVEDEENDDEFKPLTLHTNSPHAAARRISTKLNLKANFMISQQRDAAEDDSITCFGNLWRLVASGLLGAVLVSPFLYSFYQYTINAASRSSIPAYPADLLQCARDYNVSYALLHRQVQRSSSTYCSTATAADDCTCTNPLTPLRHVPSSPKYYQQWDTTHERNVQLASESSNKDKMDVVFYGDSITEHWVGTDLGVSDQESMSVKNQFDDIFGGEAVALGLAGDRCPQLLYRLQHGELPKPLDPSVIWLLIGTNDQADHCSQESILIGILNIAQYLQDQRPNARIVLNSILPKPNPTSRQWHAQNKYYDSVLWINQRLSCYAEGEVNVEYFDASRLFVNAADDVVPVDLMPDGLHPSGKGSRLWGEAILKRVEEIVEEQRQHEQAGRASAGQDNAAGRQ